MDPQAAMDLVGETFAAAFVARRRFRGSSDEELAAYLHGIARRQLSHWYRKGSARRKAMDRLGLERPALDDEAYARVEELAHSAPQRAAIRLALAELSGEQRQVLELRVVQEHSYAEIAGRLVISEQTARARVSRALRALERALADVEAAT